ncbi:MAG: sigma-70 family RNA polymerase sigma factor [Nocardioidaceae bacterium]
MDRDAAFSQYAAARWRLLVRAGVLLGCSVAEAEDLAQQTLLRCYVKWAHVQRADDRDAYVARIQLNLLRQSRRRRWSSEVAGGDLVDGVVADGTGRVDDADALARALAGLSVGQRQAVVLRYYLHLSEQQIAEATGVAPGTVKSRLSRALTALAASPGLAILGEGRT